MLFLRSIAAAAAFFAVAPAAVAQQSATAQAQPASFSEDQLRSFAAAVVELRVLGETFSPRLREAKGDEAQAVRQEAMASALTVIQKHKLTPQAFQQIIQAAQTDEALDARINNYVEEASAE